MKEIIPSIDAWNWIYQNQTNVKFSPDKGTSLYLNMFLKSGLLLFEGGHFIFTPSLSETLERISLEEIQLQNGVPLSQKATWTNLKEFYHYTWFRGKTSERKYYITNMEMVLFSSHFKGIPILESSDLLGIDLLISQVRQAIFREDYLELIPQTLQRRGYFDSGIIHLVGEKDYSISVAESYYDLITYHWDKVQTSCQFMAVIAGKEFVVVRNAHTHGRYFEDIISIISPCELEGQSECDT
jgi:hypothetical protein